MSVGKPGIVHKHEVPDGAPSDTVLPHIVQSGAYVFDVISGLRVYRCG